MAPSSVTSSALELKLGIGRMSCASCVSRIEKALKQLSGVTEVSVNLATEEASLKATPEVPTSALAEAVRKAGYEVITQSAELQIDGMSCASCVGRVEKALFKVPGVLSASVNLATEKATVEVLSGVTFATLAAAIGKAGYSAKPVAAQQPKATPSLIPEWWPVAASALLNRHMNTQNVKVRGAPLAGRPATEKSDFDFDFMHLALLHETLGTVGECR